ncbi:hypothetical protein Tco_1334400, partial [Tanacetum coccineum]
VAVGDDCSGVVTVVAKVAAGWWRPRWCGDCEGSGGEVVMVAWCCWGAAMMVMIMRVVLWWATVGRQPEEGVARGG